MTNAYTDKSTELLNLIIKEFGKDGQAILKFLADASALLIFEVTEDGKENQMRKIFQKDLKSKLETLIMFNKADPDGVIVDSLAKMLESITEKEQFENIMRNSHTV